MRSVRVYADRIGLEKTKQRQVTADHAGVTERIVLCDAQINKSSRNLFIELSKTQILQVTEQGGVDL